MNETPIIDGLVGIRVHKSIPVLEIAKAAAAIGCVLHADEYGLKIVKREVKKRVRRPTALQKHREETERDAEPPTTIGFDDPDDDRK